MALLDRIRTAASDAWRRVSGNGNQYYHPREVSQRAASGAAAYDEFALRDMLYDGTVYNTVATGGALLSVLRILNRPCRTQDEAKFPIVGYYNPVKQIVDFYANAFGGKLGEDVVIADTVNDDTPVNPQLPELVRRVWGWSNLDHRGEEMTTLAANHGSVGIRVVYKAEPSPRVYLDFDHPAYVKRIDLDNRGNVITAFLEYTGIAYDEVGGIDHTFKVEEIISKYGFSVKFDGEEQLEPGQRENPMEVCPYVWIRQKINPAGTFGFHAYHGTERMIHGINFGLSQMDESVVAHVWPYIFATASGKKPSTFQTGRYKMVYVQSEAGKPQATMDTLVPDLDFAGAKAHIDGLLGQVRERQPQTVLNAISLLSGISGETLAQVLKPAEAESKRARGIYEDGVIRAIKIAISLAIFNRVDDFDLGTGRGTREAADDAFDGGEGPEAFRFATRPYLPATTYQKIQAAQAEVADDMAKINLGAAAKKLGVSDREAFHLAGYDDKRIDEMIEEMDEMPAEDEEDEDAV